MASKPLKSAPPITEPPEALAFVVQHTPLLHDGVLHLPGDAVALTAHQALQQGANVAPAPTTEAETE